jgi:hypothetical protein
MEFTAFVLLTFIVSSRYTYLVNPEGIIVDHCDNSFLFELAGDLER